MSDLTEMITGIKAAKGVFDIIGPGGILKLYDPDAYITVTPEVLKNKSNEVKNVITMLQNDFEEMQSLISDTAHYWIGTAGDEYRRKFREYKPECEEIIRRLMEEVEDLERIAGVYEETEKDVTEIAAALPNNIIT